MRHGVPWKGTGTLVPSCLSFTSWLPGGKLCSTVCSPHDALHTGSSNIYPYISKHIAISITRDLAEHTFRRKPNTRGLTNTLAHFPAARSDRAFHPPGEKIRAASLSTPKPFTHYPVPSPTRHPHKCCEDDCLQGHMSSPSWAAAQCFVAVVRPTPCQVTYTGDPIRQAHADSTASLAAPRFSRADSTSIIGHISSK